jgi:hypothetical protein
VEKYRSEYWRPENMDYDTENDYKEAESDLGKVKRFLKNFNPIGAHNGFGRICQDQR